MIGTLDTSSVQYFMDSILAFQLRTNSSLFQLWFLLTHRMFPLKTLKLLRIGETVRMKSSDSCDRVTLAS